MDWESFKYKQISEKISDADIEKIIQVMIDNYDRDGKFYDVCKAYDIIETYVSTPEVMKNIFDIVQKGIDEERNHLIANKKTQYPFFLEDFEEINIDFIENGICEEILKHIAQLAQKKRAERIFLRHHIGAKIDLKALTQSAFLGNIEFCKDGGWGIADVNGKVIVKNHLTQRPSELSSLFNNRNCSFRIIQDRDTDLYGVLSVETLKEIIHCLYDKIEIEEYLYGEVKHYIVKVKRGNKWGCYDENCSFIIDCKYDDININGRWIECCREGDFLYSEYDFDKYIKSYEGVKDLYDTEGCLILGGYNSFDSEYGRYFKFYFGTHYEEYRVTRKDFYGHEINLRNYRLNFDNSLCLALDKQFKTIVKSKGQHLQLSLGKVYLSIQELKDTLPDEVLLPGAVDLDDYHDAFIYLKKKNECRFLISEFVEDLFIRNSSERNLHNKTGRWVDHFIEDDEIIILRIAEDGSFAWQYKVNELGPKYTKYLLYRIGERVGYYSQNGVSTASYAAISTDGNYVAQILYGKIEEKMPSNPNYIWHMQYTIQFSEITKEGGLTKIEDDWKVFCPKDYKWFPNDFLTRNGFVDDDIDVCFNSGTSYEEYGGYNGYDDDTIDYGFDGHPEATWNVD